MGNEDVSKSVERGSVVNKPFLSEEAQWFQKTGTFVFGYAQGPAVCIIIPCPIGPFTVVIESCSTILIQTTLILGVRRVFIQAANTSISDDLEGIRSQNAGCPMGEWASISGRARVRWIGLLQLEYKINVKNVWTLTGQSVPRRSRNQVEYIHETYSKAAPSRRLRRITLQLMRKGSMNIIEWHSYSSTAAITVRSRAVSVAFVTLEKSKAVEGAMSKEDHKLECCVLTERR
jgi:hypothetical protein